MESKKYFACEICEKRFANNQYKKQFSLLSLVHGEDKQFVCNVCNFSLSSENELTNHIKNINGGQKNKKCGTCGKSFTKSGILKAHILIHEGKKNYKWDSCGKSFTQSGSLKRNMLIHEGLRNYKCESCGKSSTRAGDLKKHFMKDKGIINVIIVENPSLEEEL